MDIKEANKVLEELSKDVRPEILNEKAKRLFDAINKIADERDIAVNELDKKDKIINEMAIDLEYINAEILDEYDKIPYAESKQKIIDYFTKKVEGK